MRLILAAGESDLRLALQLLLTEEPNVDVVGTASTEPGLLALLNTYQVDLVILDMDLLSKNSHNLISKIKNSESNPKIILLKDEKADQQAISELGVDAYVNKGEPPERLLAAFRRISLGLMNR